MTETDGSSEAVILATAGYDHPIKFWQADSRICHRTAQHPDSASLTRRISFYWNHINFPTNRFEVFLNFGSRWGGGESQTFICICLVSVVFLLALHECHQIITIVEMKDNY